MFLALVLAVRLWIGGVVLDAASILDDPSADSRNYTRLGFSEC